MMPHGAAGLVLPEQQPVQRQGETWRKNCVPRARREYHIDAEAGIETAMSDTTTVRVRITGQVQGVWYRGWTVDHARRLGLSGWVRNRRDGSVEAMFSGPEPAVRAMIELCRHGPPAALVHDVAETIETAPLEPGFRQVPTV
jgi:acylphosphatase